MALHLRTVATANQHLLALCIIYYSADRCSTWPHGEFKCKCLLAPPCLRTVCEDDIVQALCEVGISIPVVGEANVISVHT